MTPERWQSIEQLYHATLERRPGERERFLASACEGDEALRAEVTSLIAHRLSAPEFLDVPPGQDLRAAMASRLQERLLVPGRYLDRTFGPYTLQALLAAGGMGEVYRAVDTRLNRTVAVKILLHDPERVDFRREAEIVSSLNHPHICTIHDIGSEDGVDYLVMEYLEGETLQQRLARGALPLVRAVEYAVQIVDALDKAHRRGIVHRDIKPANVMLTASGVKLLDFGIATRHAGADRRWAEEVSPEANAPAGGRWVLATPPYGAPEQLAGRPVDARADIFAFGAVAYEMITGRRAFPGDTAEQVVASVMRDQAPPIRDLVPAVPETLARALARCLAKEPDERWQTANDLLFELRSLATARQSDSAASDPGPWMPRWAERAVWGAALAAALAVYSVDRRDQNRDAASPPPDLRFDLRPEPGTAYASSFDVPLALAPDGRRLAYVAVGRDNVKRLWIRRLDQTTAAAFEIAGSEDANTPFWSPDSVWVGFFSRNRLLKVRPSDRRVLIIATHVSTMAGASWSRDGVILFVGGPGGLSRVSADGGPVTPATAEDGSHFWPQFVGDGRHFVYAAALPGEIRLGSLTGGPSRTLMKLRFNPTSLGYAPGYLFFGRESRLFARAFDEATLQLTGEPIELLTGIPISQLGRMPFSVSAAGPLAVWPYAGGTPATLQWFTERSAGETIVEKPARYVGLALAPDGRRMALSRRNADGLVDVWLRDLAASTSRRDGLSMAAGSRSPRRRSRRPSCS
jgi:eukaryotic-like serine/threonine-protein kinase